MPPHLPRYHDAVLYTDAAGPCPVFLVQWLFERLFMLLATEPSSDHHSELLQVMVRLLKHMDSKDPRGLRYLFEEFVHVLGSLAEAGQLVETGAPTPYIACFVRPRGPGEQTPVITVGSWDAANAMRANIFDLLQVKIAWRCKPGVF